MVWCPSCDHFQSLSSADPLPRLLDKFALMVIISSRRDGTSGQGTKRRLQVSDGHCNSGYREPGRFHGYFLISARYWLAPKDSTAVAEIGYLGTKGIGASTAQAPSWCGPGVAPTLKLHTNQPGSQVDGSREATREDHRKAG